MYVPHSVQFAQPVFALWRGQSGRTYEFAVLSPERLSIAAPVVFVLSRQRGGHSEALFVGHAERLGGDDGFDATWIAAREMGMTHVHASFDALWQPARAAQVADLVGALSPPLNARAVEEDAEHGRPTARIYRLPERGSGARDTATRAVEADGGAAEAGLTESRQLPFLARRIGLPSERLWSMIRAAGRAIERLMSRGRQHQASPPGSTEPATAAPFAPTEAWQPEFTRTDDDGPVERAEDAPPAAAPADPSVVAPETGRSIRARLNLPEEAPVVLFAGHMAESSGVDILIEAIITVAATDPAVHFVLAGSGSLAAAAEARAGAAQLGSRCRFTGDLDAAACRAYLTAADCVVVPAHAPLADGFAEAALAAGKPVLTTHQAQLTAVHHGVNGLVAYDNANSLVWGLRELLSMRAEHRSLFESSRHVA